MGQVPKNTPPKYVLIGDGRAARHLSQYLRFQNATFTQWARRTHTPQQLSEMVRDSDVILLAIKDAAIEPFIASHPQAELQGKVLIHFSGALSTSKAYGCHPLMSFGPELYDAQTYRAMAFVCDDDAPEFAQLFPQLPNPSFRIPRATKALYHALCVLSGNFTVVLWQKLFNDLEARFGIPGAVALPYLNQITHNLARDSKAALTGPLQRKDSATIRANFEALKGDPFQEIYAAFARTLAEGSLP